MNYTNNEYLHSELTSKIIGAAMRVHNYQGLGFPEAIYHNSLCAELILNRIKFEREKPIEIFYYETKVGMRKADIVVEEKVLIEIKALSELEPVHTTQTLNYFNFRDTKGLK